MIKTMHVGPDCFTFPFQLCLGTGHKVQGGGGPAKSV